MKIYTKTGDDGNTGLQGNYRIAKSHPRIVAYGTVDEANAALGIVLSNSLDDDVTNITTEKFKDGREYFVYEIYAPYAKTGTHFGAAVTVKDDLVYLFVVGGNDKQWSGNSSALMNDTLRSFRA